MTHRGLGRALLLALSCLVDRVTHAQDPARALQLADRGPRFVSAPQPNAPSVDVSNAPFLKRRLTLELDRVPLDEALRAVGRQAGVAFAFAGTGMPVDKPVSVSATNITLRGALYELLVDTDLDVQLSANGLLIIAPRVAAKAVGARKQQGTGTIAGQVTDGALKSPLSQVAVRVEGTSLGAVSGADGKYTIVGVAPGTYRVIARRVGYVPLTKDVTLSADQRTTLDFALIAAPTKLDEVVTTAVGQQRRYEVGNVISTINADSITPTAPITSLTDLISARAPGVEVLETGGLTGSGGAIRIRGQSSLVLEGDPIVIVDGVRQDNTAGGTYTPVGPFNSGVVTPSPSRLNDLDFHDIESIDVLKGPAASTEYGTDAANGVIVITTKHGTAGRPQWRASAEGAVSGIPERFPSVYRSWGHTTDASHTPVACPLVPLFINSGYGSSASTCVVDSVTSWDPLNSSAYSIFGTGNRQKYNLSLSGGSEAARYFISGGLSNETGVLQLPSGFVPEATALGMPHAAFNPNGEEQRSVRVNTAIRLGPTADVAVSGAYLATYQRTPGASLLNESVGLGQPLRDSVNSYGYGTAGYDSPVYQFGQPTSQNADRLTGGVTGTWHPTAWAVVHATVGLDHGSAATESAILPQIASLNVFYPLAQLDVGSATTDIYTVDLRASATAAVLPGVRGTTSVGLQMADTRVRGTSAFAQGVTTTNFTLNGAVNPIVTQLGNRQATLGGYGEEGLALAERLFLTGALRIDAASGFGQAYSTAAYPKASLSWLAVSQGATTVRVRGAFGESGVQPPNGAALQLYAPATAWLGGGPVSGEGLSNVQNQLLRPERSVEEEGGVDLTLGHNRATVELTAYAKTTRDALVNLGTGWEAGSLPFEENIGEVRNIGIEGTVTASVVQARRVSWDVTVNASVNRNKLLALAPGVLSTGIPNQPALIGQYRFAAGYPLYGYWAPPVHYADLNHDGIIEGNEVTVADSLAYTGTSTPTREASLGTHVSLWGGAVSIGGLADYRGGFRLLNASAYHQVYGQTDAASNFRAAPLSQQARDVATVVIITTGVNGFAPPPGFYEDGTFLRIRELSLTYAFPGRLVRGLRLQRLDLTAAVRNLALWTRYGGVDPEVASAGGENLQLSPTSNTYTVSNNVREDVNTVPLLRSWIIRLNAGL